MLAQKTEKELRDIAEARAKLETQCREKGIKPLDPKRVLELAMKEPDPDFKILEWLEEWRAEGRED